MLRFISSLFLFALSALALSAQEQALLVVGNCQTEESAQMEYVGSDEGTGFALNFSRYKMRAYKGNSLTTVNIQFDGKATGYIFISRGVEDEPVFTQEFEAKRGWNEIVLDTPYAIDGSELTIGYINHTLPGGTLAYGNALVEGKEYVRRNGKWETFTKGSGRMTAVLQGDALPKCEVALDKVLMPTFVLTGSDATAATADVVNLGTDVVEAITVLIHEDNEVLTSRIEGLQIAPRSKTTVSIPFTLATDGDYNLWMEVSEVNGGADAAPIDNTSAQQEVYARKDFGQRNVLLEVFSTERCTNCPAGHQTIESTLGDKPHIIEMTHHAGFFTDKFSIPESTEYEWFYKSDQYAGTFAPAFMTDRTSYASRPSDYLYGTPIASSVSSKLLKAAYNEAVTVPALAVIGLKAAFDDTQRNLGIDVDARALVAAKGYEHPALNVFIIEDEVFSKTQENSFGNYFHRHMVRKCLTTTWGEAFAAGGSISRHYDVTLEAGWNPENISVVAFVANYNAKSNADCRVMNAEEAKPDGLVVGAGCIKSDALSPTADVIYSLTGQRCNSRNLGKGIYITGNKQTKLILK